jgi:excisionase family DNA binding protein
MTNTSVRLLSVAQFAEALGVTVACCRRWILERKITFTKIGRLVRIPETEVSRLISEGLHPARPRSAQ